MPRERNAEGCGNFAASLRELSGETGHVHLLAHCPPKVPVTALANSLKGVPARRLRPEYPGRVNQARTNGHFRPPPYPAASCGGTPLSLIRHYTEQQQRPA
ncbi:MAG TPA: transposase [Streptosporangiaceae bacterium]|nr:transposase [Streptosporangiaceae bacterium]